MNLQTLRTNPWPYAIIGWFLLFGSGMAAWVIVAVRNDPELVQPDYYEQEIGYQTQIDRLNRTAAISNAVFVVHDAARGQIVLRLYMASGSDTLTGRVQFYRPSNAKLDFGLPLALDAFGEQCVPTGKLAGGLWRVRVQWTRNSQDYLHDQSVVL